MKIVYIAGPYTGDGTFVSIDKNILKAEKYQVALTNLGIGCFCPHKHAAHLNSKGAIANEDFYYALDFHFLKNIADAILVMPGWENSVGTKREVDWAKKQGMPIFFPKYYKNLSKILEWYNKTNDRKNEN